MKGNSIQKRRSVRGQTLIAALIILGVMLIVGFAFLGIITRNILQAGTSKQRTQADDLAEAGIRYAHAQLLNSALGADWRPFATPPFSPRDPDADYLRPDPNGVPGDGDEGGPDNLGPFTRVNYGTGRFLIRVRYAPSDAFLFSTSPNGPLRQASRARNYVMIESVGRVGKVSPNDPTTTLQTERRQSRKLIAFASIGMIEQAMYITNQARVSAPAEIGAPRPLGIVYETVPIDLPVFMGGALATPNMNGQPPPAIVAQGGSLFSNADLTVHGQVIANLNTTLGDGWIVNGMIRGADSQALLNVNRTFWDPSILPSGSWNGGSFLLTNGGSPSLDSRSSAFQTIFGAVRDIVEGIDIAGYWRSAGRKEPPSIQWVNPETELNRYAVLTQQSGVLLATGNDGRFGHGRGVYVNNASDRQMRFDEFEREGVGSAESLLYDWFNPNNGQAGSGWIGPYYVPRGAYLLLQSDGFTIIRDSRAPQNERTWRLPDGTDTLSQTIRYRFGLVNGQVYVINSFTPGVNINQANPNFALGRPFDGVVLFEGNVRVRGVIPTDLQLTVVSNATIYIEGSITKGVVRNDLTDPGSVPSPPQRINRPSRSSLMLMAKDYVALNTTMFFGPTPGQSLEEVTESNSPIAWNPLRMRTGGGTHTFRADQLWDPQTPGFATNPQNWEPFAWRYVDAASPGVFTPTRLLLTHATDDGPAPYTFVSLDVNYGLPNSNYYFALGSPNSATPFFQPPYPPSPTPGWSAIYGLGGETWQRYPKFESAGYTLLDRNNGLSLLANGFVLQENDPATPSQYQMLVGDLNDLTLRHNNIGFGATNDYLLARAAIVPSDILIEAAIYAEEGSWVVIPGNWYNTNPNDTRDLFNARVLAFQAAPYNLPVDQAIQAAQNERQSNFGSSPAMPFYAEPLDVKVTIFGSISQNMPLPMSYQAEWLKKWGWIPRQIGALYRFPGGAPEPVLIPQSHVPPGWPQNLLTPGSFVPNLLLVYDPMLATGRPAGYDMNYDYVRRDSAGRALAPMPCLPVSPVLSYFGEVQK